MNELLKTKRFELLPYQIGGIELAEDGTVVGEINPIFENEIGVIEERDAEEIVAAIAQVRVIKDIVTDMAARCKAAEEYILGRYGKSLEEFARDNLPKGKKSVELSGGTLAFRSAQERIKIADDESAAKVLASLISPEELDEAVRMVPNVLVTKIPAEALEQIKDNFGEGVIPDCDVAKGFTYVPAGESFSVKERKV